VSLKGVTGTIPPGWKPPARQTAYRVSESARLWRDGCTTMQIALAMRPVVCDSTVRLDLDRAGLRNRVRRVKPVRPDPPPVDWMHPLARLTAPQDRPAIAVRQFLAEMSPDGTGRGITAHAHDLLEARRLGDQAWEQAWLGYISQVQEAVSALGRLHADDAFLRAAALGRSPEITGGSPVLQGGEEARAACRRHPPAIDT